MKWPQNGGSAAFGPRGHLAAALSVKRTKPRTTFGFTSNIYHFLATAEGCGEQTRLHYLHLLIQRCSPKDGLTCSRRFCSAEALQKHRGPQKECKNWCVKRFRDLKAPCVAKTCCSG